METYLDVRKKLTERYLRQLKIVDKYRDLIEAIESSPDFQIVWAQPDCIRIAPIEKVSFKELSIQLDEIFFDLPHLAEHESVDESDLTIRFGNYPDSFNVYVNLKEFTTCRIVQMSSKTHVHTWENRTYAVFCD